jgi:2-C-methyl-D-erythritol 4-phosphate cytidylyltransferase
VIAAAPLTDTIKLARTARDSGSGPVEGGSPTTVAETLDRDALWSAETPQAFRLAALERAQRLAADAGELDAATDEAWLIERAGGTVLLEETGAANFKVTSAADLAAAAALIAAAESR